MNELQTVLAPIGTLEELVVGIGLGLMCLAAAAILFMVGAFIARRGGGR